LLRPIRWRCLERRRGLQDLDDPGDAGPAPYNNAGLDFTPDFPGLPDPAPIRSFVTGTVTEALPGDRGTISGTITSFLCQSGQATDQITVSYRGHYGAEL
jgi:hypothetical protein